MDKRIIALALLALASLQLCHCTENVLTIQQNILSKLLADSNNSSSYSKYIVPIKTDANLNGTGTVIVTTNMLIRNIEALDEANHQWKVQITYRQQWNDARLAYDDYNGRINWINIPDSKQIWIPDTFFKNEKSSYYHDLMKRNELIRVYPKGDVLYSTRMTLTLSCPMWFSNFPEDVQVCSIDLASYGHTTDDILFKWKETYPVQVSMSLSLAKFRLEKYFTDYCTSRTNTGAYSCMTAQFLFRRVSSSYFTSIYLPFTILIIVSWLAFWIDARRQFFGRLFLGSSILLTIICLTVHLNGSFPATTYTRRIDTWMTACLVFTFVALLETAVVHYILGVDEETEKLNRIGQILRPLGRPLDRISRIAFPGLFVVFLIYYRVSSNVEDNPYGWTEYNSIY